MAALQVAIGGGDHPHVRANRLASAHALEFPLLQNAQQRDLSFRGQLADFIQKDGASFGQLEPAEAPLQRSGKGALLVAEQLRGDQRGGYGRAIHAHEGSRGALRPLVDGASDEFLARARLAGDQNRGIRRRDLGDARQDGLQSRRLAHDLLEHRCFVDFFPQRDVLFVELVPQFLDFVEGLLQIGFRPLALGDVRHRSDELKAARLVRRGMADDPDVFDGSIGHQQPMFKIEFLPLAGNALDRLAARPAGLPDEFVARTSSIVAWAAGSYSEDSKRLADQ